MQNDPLRLKPGHVIGVQRLTERRGVEERPGKPDRHGALTLERSAGRGNLFVMLLLGGVRLEEFETCDPEEMLRALGWVRVEELDREAGA